MAQDIYVSAHAHAPEAGQEDGAALPMGSPAEVRRVLDAELPGISWSGGALGRWNADDASLLIDVGYDDPCMCVALKQRGASDEVDRALDAMEARGWYAYLAIFGVWRHRF